MHVMGATTQSSSGSTEPRNDCDSDDMRVKTVHTVFKIEPLRIRVLKADIDEYPLSAGGDGPKWPTFGSWVDAPGDCSTLVPAVEPLTARTAAVDRWTKPLTR